MWQAFFKRLQQDPSNGWGVFIQLWFMYVFKIAPCPIKDSHHEWSTCFFQHDIENSQRRDLRRHSYTASECPQYKYAL